MRSSPHSTPEFILISHQEPERIYFPVPLNSQPLSGFPAGFRFRFRFRPRPHVQIRLICRDLNCTRKLRLFFSCNVVHSLQLSSPICLPFPADVKQTLVPPYPRTPNLHSP